jgi:hypothetical protein
MSSLHVADPEHLEFQFDFALPERVAGLFFGVTPDSSWLALCGGRLIAVFGPWRVETTLANVAGAELTGPYRWPRIIGPAHISLRDQGLTFATSNQQGVCIRFREPVPGIDPLGLIRHPGLTVTVDDAPVLVEVLEAAARRFDEDSERVRRHPNRPLLDDPADTKVSEVLEDVGDELQSLTARELRERARSLGISGVSSMRKSELVDALLHAPGEGDGGGDNGDGGGGDSPS